MDDLVGTSKIHHYLCLDAHHSGDESDDIKGCNFLFVGNLTSL